MDEIRWKFRYLIPPCFLDYFLFKDSFKSFLIGLISPYNFALQTFSKYRKSCHLLKGNRDWHRSTNIPVNNIEIEIRGRKHRNMNYEGLWKSLHGFC